MTHKEFIEFITIIAKYTPKGLDNYCTIQPEHDVFHTDLYVNKTSPEDTKRLLELGCNNTDEEWWTLYT